MVTKRWFCPSPFFFFSSVFTIFRHGTRPNQSLFTVFLNIRHTFPELLFHATYNLQSYCKYTQICKPLPKDFDKLAKSTFLFLTLHWSVKSLRYLPKKPILVRVSPFAKATNKLIRYWSNQTMKSSKKVKDSWNCRFWFISYKSRIFIEPFLRFKIDSLSPHSSLS